VGLWGEVSVTIDRAIIFAAASLVPLDSEPNVIAGFRVV